MTSMNADSVDIYVEWIKDGKYYYEGEWFPLREEVEEFYVRGKGIVKHSYWHTANGVLFE
jgi:acyl-homoserine lactone acylase PvdQ